MKRIALLCCLGLFSIMTDAQPRPFPPERMGDDEIIQMQTRDIVSWLELDGKDKDRFIKEYTSFRKEIDELARNARPPRDMNSEDEIDKAIQQNFAISEQILQIRKKYYLVFKDFMKPSQIQMMYHIENEAGRRMHGAPGRPNRPGDRPLPPRHRDDDSDF